MRQSLHVIGRDLGKPHNSMRVFLSQHGGIVPALRRRSLLVLTTGERGDISRGLKALTGGGMRRKNYSEWSACMTSMRAARAAGSVDATTAAPSSTNAETITGNTPGIFRSPK